jgi:hypothetical protein
VSGKAKVSLGYLHPGHVEACFHESLIDLLFYDASHHGRLMHTYGKMGKRAGSAGIVDGRNQLAQIMVDESEADWLCMIDADMGFAPDTIERLIDAAHAIERPVVGALCFAYAIDGKASFYGARWRAMPTLYDWVEDEDEDDVGFLPRVGYEPDVLQEVSATGAACVLIHRLTLQAIRDKYGDCWFDPIVHPGGRKFSEDLSFCVRVAGCDIPMHVHTGIKTTHCKGAVYYDEEYFQTQQMVRAL